MFDTKSNDNFLPYATNDDFDLKRSKLAKLKGRKSEKPLNYVRKQNHNNWIIVAVLTKFVFESQHKLIAVFTCTWQSHATFAREKNAMAW